MDELLNDIKININEVNKMEDSNDYQIIIQIPTKYGWIDDVNFIIDFDYPKETYSMEFIKEENGTAFFKTNISLKTRAIYHYYFTCKINGNQIYLKKKNNTNLNTITESESFKTSVNFDVPNWAKGKVMYHIFVDRFNRGSEKPLQYIPKRKIHNSWEEDINIGPDENGYWNTDFYGGDLKGIENKLPYLKSLGVDIIYLSPIVQSQSNHRYDAADYEQVDPYAGTNEDLKTLCQKAHDLDMKIILDAVFNHTGNDSKYFNEYGTYEELGAYQSENSIYRPFYYTHNENGQTKYEYWWGMKNLPRCNCYSKQWLEYITKENGIIDKWFKLGIDGLRLDVADELSDEYIMHIRKAVKRNKKDGFIIGEVWENPMRMNRDYVYSGKAMDSVMNYLLADALIRYFKYGDDNKLNYIINDILTEYPDDTIKTLMNFTSTHDITRAINIFACNEFDYNGKWAWNLKNENPYWCKEYKLTKEEYEKGKQIYESYIFTLNFLPGILSIFYGDEIGMQGMGNLSNRRPYPKNNHDEDLLNFFKQILNIRKIEPFLEEADLEIKDINDKYFIYERYDRQNKILVAINRTDNEESFEIPNEYKTPSKVYTLHKSSPGHLHPHGAVAIKK